MTAHKHAALMAEYVKDALETDKPWERWEYFSGISKKWLQINGPFYFDGAYEYRRKRIPLCQVEGKDVFAGDKLWHTGEKQWMTVEALASTPDSVHMTFYGTALLKNLSWTEPPRTKTGYQWAVCRLGKWHVTASMFTTEDDVKAVFFNYKAYRRLDYTALEVPCDD